MEEIGRHGPLRLASGQIESEKVPGVLRQAFEIGPGSACGLNGQVIEVHLTILLR